MSVSDPRDRPPQDHARHLAPEDPSEAGAKDRHGGHSRWMMIACCIPMLAIAVALVAAGGGGGFLIIAIACTVMMAMMMLGMGGGNDRPR